MAILLLLLAQVEWKSDYEEGLKLAKQKRLGTVVHFGAET